jgi:Protein of unknown function (DUF3892)
VIPYFLSRLEGFAQMAIRITRIKKPHQHSTHDAIEKLEWINEATGAKGTVNRIDLYNWIKKGGKAYVKDAFRDIAYVGTRENIYGTKYVQTYADRTWRDNLLALPRFV